MDHTFVSTKFSDTKNNKTTPDNEVHVADVVRYMHGLISQSMVFPRTSCRPQREGTLRVSKVERRAVSREWQSDSYLNVPISLRKCVNLPIMRLGI